VDDIEGDSDTKMRRLGDLGRDGQCADLIAAEERLVVKASRGEPIDE
jgi:hypothetical protein